MVFPFIFIFLQLFDTINLSINVTLLLSRIETAEVPLIALVNLLFPCLPSGLAGHYSEFSLCLSVNIVFLYYLSLFFFLITPAVKGKQGRLDGSGAVMCDAVHAISPFCFCFFHSVWVFVFACSEPAALVNSDEIFCV